MKISYLRMAAVIAASLYGALSVESAPGFRQLAASLDSRSLPLVNLTVDTTRIGSSHFTPGRIEIIDPLRRTDNSLSVSYDCQLRYRGAWSLNYEKKSFAVKLVDSDGGKLDTGLLGMRCENSWILDAMAFDCMRMRNRVCFDLWNSFSRVPYDTDYDRRNGTEGQFVEVFLNGSYHGLYCLSDKVDRRLLGLKKAKADNEGGVTLRGLLYKCVDTAFPADLLLEYGDYPTDSTRWDAWELQYPDDHPSEAAWQPLKDLIDFCAYDNSTNEEFARRTDEWFYMDNLVDYFVFCNALMLLDNIKNRFLSVPDITAGHRYLHTPWDMDVSLGFDTFDRLTDSTAGLWFYHRMAPYARLHTNEHSDFDHRVCARWEELRQGVLSPDSVSARLYSYARWLDASGAWQRERSKWNANPRQLDSTAVSRLPQVMAWYERNCEELTRQLEPFTNVTPVHRSVSPSSVYDLQGRRVNSPSRRGVYIKDGRKIIR